MMELQQHGLWDTWPLWLLPGSLGQALAKKVKLEMKSKLSLPHNLAIPLLGIHSKYLKTGTLDT